MEHFQVILLDVEGLGRTGPHALPAVDTPLLNDDRLSNLDPDGLGRTHPHTMDAPDALGFVNLYGMMECSGIHSGSIFV